MVPATRRRRLLVLTIIPLVQAAPAVTIMSTAIATITITRMRMATATRSSTTKAAAT
ncbi:MAG TPA: hypothetical protein VN153_07015 [Tahibacter sp.]|nr:hypothetical protein [Tahibacter sp.]